jgi:hypothetical protein
MYHVEEIWASHDRRSVPEQMVVEDEACRDYVNLRPFHADVTTFMVTSAHIIKFIRYPCVLIVLIGKIVLMNDRACETAICFSCVSNYHGATLAPRCLFRPHCL